MSGFSCDESKKPLRALRQEQPRHTRFDEQSHMHHPSNKKPFLVKKSDWAALKYHPAVLNLLLALQRFLIRYKVLIFTTNAIIINLGMTESLLSIECTMKLNRSLQRQRARIKHHKLHFYWLLAAAVLLLDGHPKFLGYFWVAPLWHWACLTVRRRTTVLAPKISPFSSHDGYLFPLSVEPQHHISARQIQTTAEAAGYC